MNIRRVLIGILCWSLPIMALAQGGIAWEQLSPEQRQLLEPLQPDGWDRIPPNRQQDLLRGMERWQDLTPEQQQKAKKRLQDWQGRSQEQRDQIRKRFDHFRELDPAEQKALRERFREFQALPEAQRRQLRERFLKLPPGERPPGPPRGFRGLPLREPPPPPPEK